MAKSIIQRKEGLVTLEVYVQPGAKCSEWAGKHGGRLRIRVAGPPVDGAANKALIEFVATSFKIKKRQVEILSGEKGRYKRLALNSISVDEVSRRLEELVSEKTYKLEG